MNAITELLEPATELVAVDIGGLSCPGPLFAEIDRHVKTRYIYIMNGRLVNVRLDEKRLERARKLRARGIVLSDLIREAIDKEYERLSQVSTRRDVEAIMKQIYERYPDPPDLPPREYDVHNRAEAKIGTVDVQHR